MERIYYNKGMIFDKNTKIKLERDCKLCNWCSKKDIDQNFIGFTEGEKIYDLCSYLLKKSRKIEEERQKKYTEDFNKIKQKIKNTIEIVERFNSSLSEISEIKSNIRSLNKKLKNGYVMQQNQIIRGKKSRRYKKDNRRFLTETEINNMKEEVENLNSIETNLSKKINFELLLETIIKNMNKIDINLMNDYNNRFEWFETVGLYKDYISIIEKLKLKINHFTFNNLKEKYEIQGKDLDIVLEDISIFEETFEKIENKVMGDLEIEERMEVKDKRKVTKKAKFYLDENGSRIELDSNINQVVIKN